MEDALGGVGLKENQTTTTHFWEIPWFLWTWSPKVVVFMLVSFPATTTKHRYLSSHFAIAPACWYPEDQSLLAGTFSLRAMATWGGRLDGSPFTSGLPKRIGLEGQLQPTTTNCGHPSKPKNGLEYPFPLGSQIPPVWEGAEDPSSTRHGAPGRSKNPRGTSSSICESPLKIYIYIYNYFFSSSDRFLLKPTRES